MSPPTRSKYQPSHFSGIELKPNEKASKKEVKLKPKTLKVKVEDSEGLRAASPKSLPLWKSTSKMVNKSTIENFQQSTLRYTKELKTTQAEPSVGAEKLFKEETIKKEDPEKVQENIKKERNLDGERSRKRRLVKEKRVKKRHSKRQTRVMNEEDSSGEEPMKRKSRVKSQRLEEPKAWLLCGKHNIWIGPDHALF
jgi:hypothetical protein